MLQTLKTLNIAYLTAAVIQLSHPHHDLNAKSRCLHLRSENHGLEMMTPLKPLNIEEV